MVCDYSNLKLKDKQNKQKNSQKSYNWNKRSLLSWVITIGLWTTRSWGESWPFNDSILDLFNFKRSSYKNMNSFNYMACVCSRDNERSDWPTKGHYSPVIPTDRLLQRPSRKLYKKQLINLKHSVVAGNPKPCTCRIDRTVIRPLQQALSLRFSRRRKYLIHRRTSKPRENVNPIQRV